MTDANGSREVGSPPFWSPYVAGFGLGVLLLLSFRILGAGLGASGGIARVAAWIGHTIAPVKMEASAYFGSWFDGSRLGVLRYYLVFMAAGTFLGGWVSAAGSGRIRPGVERGPRVTSGGRLVVALVGGVLVGFASRLARGCTSGQALTGTALLLTGSVVFVACIFVGGYAAAPLVRRMWR